MSLTAPNSSLPEPTLTFLTGVELSGSEVSLDEQKKLGEYQRISSCFISERFPLTLLAGPSDLILAHFGVITQGEAVEAWAKENGYEPALIDHLLVVGSHPACKNLQVKFPISALGSFTVIHGRRASPYLYRDDDPNKDERSQRYLDISWHETPWGASTRFLLHPE